MHEAPATASQRQAGPSFTEPALVREDVFEAFATGRDTWWVIGTRGLDCTRGVPGGRYLAAIELSPEDALAKAAFLTHALRVPQPKG